VVYFESGSKCRFWPNHGTLQKRESLFTIPVGRPITLVGDSPAMKTWYVKLGISS